MLKFPWNSAQEFGKALDDFRATLENLYGMTERAGRSNTRVLKLDHPVDLNTKVAA